MQVEAIQQIKQIDHIVEKVDVIGIDEGQFYPDLVERVEDYVRKDKIVIISALDGTFERKPFGQIPQIIPLADDVIKLRAICMQCGEDAPFTHRLGKINDFIFKQSLQRKLNWWGGKIYTSLYAVIVTFSVQRMK